VVRNEKTHGLPLAKPSILKTRNCFHVKRTVLISRPVTCSSQRRLCRTFLSVSCAAVVLVAELAAMPQVTYARADTRFVALPLVRSRQNHLRVRAFING
jgi:hypothetical protein